MPAFTFEKIPAPAPGTPAAPAVEKRRGVIVQMLDRFVEVRARRIFFFRRKKSSSARRTKPQG